jgi:hypothetical protein
MLEGSLKRILSEVRESCKKRIIGVVSACLAVETAQYCTHCTV